VPEGSRLGLKQYDWLKDRLVTSANVEKVKRLATIAQTLGCTRAQLAIAWCLANPHVSTVITGATRPEQVRENLKALEVVPKLTGEVRAQIEAIFPLAS
jgi:aryl-alcohol dehydrogenase-like predicted oxidoreductase